MQCKVKSGKNPYLYNFRKQKGQIYMKYILEKCYITVTIENREIF